MSELQPLIERYGPAVLFLNVLLEQLGLPIPAYPALIVAGALAIQGHGISLGEALAVATLACLIADSAWYFAGQRYGGFLLRSICRVSLSRDSCIRQSQSLYLRIGPRALLISKFLPGAGALSTSLAGMTGTSMRRFLGYDLAGSALWAGSALLLGAIFNDAVDHLLSLLHDYASLGALVILGAFVLFLTWRVFRRQRLLRRTARIPRISVSELRRRLDQGNAPRILDVRAELGEDGIPGAISVGLDTPLDSLKDTLGDADVVIYCACPHELSAAMLAERLQAGGYARTWALSGGLDAWHAHQEQALS